MIKADLTSTALTELTRDIIAPSELGPGTGSAPADANEPQTAQVDGVCWKCLPRACRLLGALTRHQWEQPREQGWQLVKSNARREVWRATIDGTPVYLKYFLPGAWHRRLRDGLRGGACRAEWEGSLYALRTGIAAARPLAYTRDLRRGKNRCGLLITESAENALSLADFWLQLMADENTRRRRADVAHLAEVLGELIARAHQSGFEHLDMHAANILVCPVAPRRYRAVFIDLQSARRGVPLSDGAVVRTLAQLNQWFHKNSPVTDRLRFLRAYTRWRDEYEGRLPHGRRLGLSFEELVARLKHRARRHAAGLGARRDRRALRDGRYFVRLRLGDWRGVAIRHSKHPCPHSCASQMTFERGWWSTVLRPWLVDVADAAPAGAMLKDSHSGQVSRTVLAHPDGPLQVIIKRPRARSAWRSFVQLWPPSRSMRGWQTGHALLHRDLPAPRPLAVLERRLGPLVRESLLVTEAVPSAGDLESYLKNQPGQRSSREWAAVKHVLAERLAHELRRLHERGFVHRDCKASNLLVLGDPARAETGRAALPAPAGFVQTPLATASGPLQPPLVGASRPALSLLARLDARRTPGPQPTLMWVDMDGIRAVGPRADRYAMRAIARLNVSVDGIAGLTLTDRARFLRAYFRRYGSDPRAWRRAWHELRVRSAAKRRAKQARRRWKLAHYGRE